MRPTAAFRSIINAFYLAAAEDQGKAGPLFFAEKCQLAGLARWFSRALFGNTREIVLVRDARDTVCSYRSFWSQPIGEAIRLLKLSCDALMAVRNEQQPDTLFVRYEDMIAREAEALQRVAAFAGIRDFAPADAEAEQALFREHGTSKSPDSSIGRWKRDLSADEVKAPACANSRPTWRCSATTCDVWSASRRVRIVAESLQKRLEGLREGSTLFGAQFVLPASDRRWRVRARAV